ncbi:MAG: RHS repeat protein [Verrucomicrobia bacterium]|nr:RHS repeat protein [Verrucomicrobiota bacterium]
MLIILLILLGFRSLLAETRPTVANPFVFATTEGEPHLNICDAVSPITGDFYLSRNDIIIEGVEPLHIPTSYISGEGTTKYKGKVGWEFVPPHQLILFTCKKCKIAHVIITEKNGTRFKLERTIGNEYHINLKYRGPGIANDAKGTLSARSHLRNCYAVEKNSKKITFRCADGTKRRYEFCKKDKDIDIAYSLYLLKWERLPNGNYIYYEYDSENRLKYIQTTNPQSDKVYAWARFKYKDKPEVNPSFKIETSDGRVLKYKFKPSEYPARSEGDHSTEYIKVFVLDKITRSFGPPEFFSYCVGQIDQGLRVSEVSLPGRRFFAPAYYQRKNNDVGGINIHLKKRDCRINRVKTLSAPVGFTEAQVTTHRFFYSPNKKKDYSYKDPCQTDVYDAANNLTRIIASEFCRPHEIQYYQEHQGEQQLVFTEKTFWSNQKLEIGNLKAKLFSDHMSSSSYAKIYQYDIFGNVTSEKLCGNLSGQGPSSVSLQIPPPGPSQKMTFSILDHPGHDLLVTDDVNSNHGIYLFRVAAGLYVAHPDSAATAQVAWRLLKSSKKEANFLKVNTSNPGITHSPTEIYETTFGYTSHHLMAWKKEPSGRITRFSYLDSTDLLSSRFTCEGNKILLREFFEYNDDRIIIQTIHDDGCGSDPQDLTGVTERHIKRTTLLKSGPHVNFPETIEELYLEQGQEKLLRKTVLAYNKQGKITSQDIYDGNGQLRYRLTHEYDGKGRMISESNPLGQVQRYGYDEFDNKTVIQDFSGRLTIRHTYDYSHRLIQTLEESDEGNRRATYHKYNHKNQRISTLDPQGRETLFTYDAFDHLLETKLPTSHILQATYDGFGRQLSKTDGNGHITTQTYNARGKPISIHHPDGTQETYIYNLDGSLKFHIDQVGTLIEHAYDILGRLISKTITSSARDILSTESWSYGTFQLLSKTDPAGTVTSYEYDGAGRKIAEICKGNRTSYGYDALGRLSRTERGGRVIIQDYDLMDRIIEERTENLEGAILIKTLYAYDPAGNQSEITHWTAAGPSTEMTLYDAFKRPIQHADALGHITTIIYDDHFKAGRQEVLQKTTTDPAGIRRIETYNLLGHLAALEIKNTLGELLHQEIYTYDGAGNKVRQETIVMSPRAPPKTITTLWEYGPLRRLLSLTEAAGTPYQRTTRYAYTLKGLVQEIHKPDGRTLFYAYDALHRLHELTSSDNSFHYIYTYNAIHQPIIIDELVQNTRTLRAYDAQGLLTFEKLANGLTLQSTYDTLGRKTHLYLPDKSSASYFYDAAFLRQITRYSSAGETLYSHRYTRFDPSGHLLEQELIHHLGTQNFEIDSLGRTVASSCYYFDSKESVFDSRGHLLSLLQDSNLFRFTYDDLAQLTAENNHRYVYDSNHNRIVKDNKTSTTNSLNQFDPFTYDFNGNLVSDDSQTYSYDALDRLVSVTSPSHHAQFTYDAFHRRLSKKLFAKKDGAWIQQSELSFLYDGDNEIGAVDSSGALIELRVLGLGKGAEIGASVAIELEGRSFAPLHDLRGNIIKLISSTGEITEMYSYTAFGEETVQNPQNPWRFSSKRTDTEFNLVHFGRRFYSPALGRWLTPDPQGFTDGMNLYAFVHNNPLLKLDLHGLEAINYNINVSVSLNTCLQLASLTTSCLGMGIAAMGKHALPGRLGDMTHALGNALAGLPYTRPRSQEMRVGYRHAGDSVAITAVNGILTSLQEAVKFSSMVSELHGDSPVHMIYNSSHGFFSDILEVLLDAVGIGSRPSRLLALRWQSLLLEFRAKGISDGEICHYAHSQGGSITENALRRMTPEERNHIHVVTFGSASLFSKELAKSVVHYISPRDGVPMIDLPRYLWMLARKTLGQPSPVQFVGNFWGVPFIDHPWENDGYLSKLSDHGKNFQQTHFNPYNY